MTLSVDDPRHGTPNGYNNYDCRCDACREAERSYDASRYRRPCVRGCGRMAWHRPGRRGLCVTCAAEERRTAPHGTESRYGTGCRCDDCRRAAREGRSRRRAAA